MTREGRQKSQRRGFETSSLECNVQTPAHNFPTVTSHDTCSAGSDGQHLLHPRICLFLLPLLQRLPSSSEDPSVPLNDWLSDLVGHCSVLSSIGQRRMRDNSQFGLLFSFVFSFHTKTLTHPTYSVTVNVPFLSHTCHKGTHTHTHTMSDILYIHKYIKLLH